MEILSIADAVAALSYLHSRELLCDTCGIRLGEYRSQFKSFCEGCKPKNGDFRKTGVANGLEKCVFSALSRWLSDHPDADERRDDIVPPYRPGST